VAYLFVSSEFRGKIYIRQRNITDMPKRCIICGKEARFMVKDSSDFYCEECALEQFGELSLLVKVEDQAAKLKKAVDDKLDTQSEIEPAIDEPDPEIKDTE
jgi:hypothetical protein